MFVDRLLLPLAILLLLLLTGCCEVDHYAILHERICVQSAEAEHCNRATGICIVRCLKYEHKEIHVPVCR